MTARTGNPILDAASRTLRLGIMAASLTALMVFVPFYAGAQTGAGRYQPQPPASARPPKYPIGTAVNVHLKNKQTITGRVEKYGNDGFWVQAEGQDPRRGRKIFYFEMQSVNAASEGAGKKGRFSLDFLMGGTGASVRVYTPKPPKEDDGSH